MDSTKEVRIDEDCCHITVYWASLQIRNLARSTVRRAGGQHEINDQGWLAGHGGKVDDCQETAIARNTS